MGHAEADPALILPRRRERLSDVAARRMHRLVVVLDNLQDPHNASAVLRSCDAFGVQNVYVIERSRAFSISQGVAQGCDRWLTVHRADDPDRTLSELKSADYALLSADPTDDATSLYDVDFAGNVALVFGNETDGVAGETRAHCDGSFVIPMAGFSRSLNVSVAAAVSLSWATRQRRDWLGDAQTDDPVLSHKLLDFWLDRECLSKKRRPVP